MTARAEVVAVLVATAPPLSPEQLALLRAMPPLQPVRPAAAA